MRRRLPGAGARDSRSPGGGPGAGAGSPRVAWASAPWFSDARFVGALTAAGLADASLNITDYGSDLDSDEVREHLRPWFRAIAVVCDREPAAADMARMAILLRFCGRTDESLALCERADSIERVMLTEVVRAGTWRRLGDRQETAAAFRRALRLDPANWSLYLDLADLAAEDGGFPAAADLVGRGLAQARSPTGSGGGSPSAPHREPTLPG
ncbi:tetratricopeptide repeat protein [Actinoplanes sp. NPDC023714]|uniref:tetratricopeptide repeat protein n=1 Tax=Actinoplanes sp. NPDC023714 TaxID=3154322 RepID=UPI0033E29A03